jgi:hypothetical protein
MQYDLALLCRDARGGIDVPAIPLTAIRNAATQRSMPLRRRVIIAVLVSALSLGAVAAAAVWHATRVYVGNAGTLDVYAHTMTIRFGHATHADAVSAAHQVTFPVVLPTGLPAGTQLRQVGRADRSALMLSYDLPGAWRRSHHLLDVVLADPAIVGSAISDPYKQRLMVMRYKEPQRTVRWRVGGEEVIVDWNNLTPAELARMKQAMLNASTQR